jgi:major membrane immunogen (membrane-anchored lipoprotein)
MVMKKKLIASILLLTSLLVSCGNQTFIDTNYTYNKAIINLGYKTIEVEIKEWKDYEDTSIQIIDKDGKVYLTDLKNVLLIKE